jgi:hypothetical protein
MAHHSRMVAERSAIVRRLDIAIAPDRPKPQVTTGSQKVAGQVLSKC